MLREVFHITKPEFIPIIQQEWLKNLQQQAEEWSLNLHEKLLNNTYISRSDWDQDLINFYVNTIYSSLNEPPIWPSWVSFMVEDSIVDVLNNHLEFQWFSKYMSSKMKLNVFLNKSKNSELLHPITAQPIDDTNIKPKWEIPRWQLYSPEVILERKSIKELARVHLGDF